MATLAAQQSVKSYSKARVIGYWIVTAFLSFELVYGALWDFNVLNKGYVDNILSHLGYPLYLGPVLGVAKLGAVIAILTPGFPVLKEWAYAGVVILFTGAFISHTATGDGLDKSFFSLLFDILAILSWALRYQRRL